MAQDKPEDSRGARGIDRWLPLALVLLFIAALGGGVVLLVQRGSAGAVEVALPEASATTVPKAYVTGAVKTPGVYEFADGDRLVDLLDMADGPLDDADTSRLNMALRLQDEGRYYIPTVGETPPVPLVPGGEAPPGPSSSGFDADGKLDLNTASAAQLGTLPNIGATRADAIIAYRQQTPFERVEDLLLVRGIGQGILDGIEDQVTVR